MLENRDYTLVIDRSGSMATRDQKGGRSRWQAMQESASALAAHCEQFDPDGLTLYLFGGKFRRYERMNAERIQQLFRETAPAGGTDLAAVLRDCFDQYFRRRDAGNAKGGETFLVVTDGEPDDRVAVMQTLIHASRKVRSHTELGVSFVQVGSDPAAASFLGVLDDELVRNGAAHDLVDTITLEDMDDTPLTDVLMRALFD